MHTECLLQIAASGKGVYKATAPSGCAGGSGTEVWACVFGAGGKRQCMHRHKEDRLLKQETEQKTLGGNEGSGDYKAQNRRKMCARSCVVYWVEGKGEGVGRCAAAAEA